MWINKLNIVGLHQSLHYEIQNFIRDIMFFIRFLCILSGCLGNGKALITDFLVRVRGWGDYDSLVVLCCHGSGDGLSQILSLWGVAVLCEPSDPPLISAPCRCSTAGSLRKACQPAYLARLPGSLSLFNLPYLLHWSHIESDHYNETHFNVILL